MVLVVAGLNFGYFGIEFAVALSIGLVSLFADSVDFIEDASVNLLSRSRSAGARDRGPGSAWGSR